MNSYGNITNRLIGVKAQNFYPNFRQVTPASWTSGITDLSCSWLFNQKGTMIVKALGNKPLDGTFTNMNNTNWVDNQWGGGVTFQDSNDVINVPNYYDYTNFGNSLTDRPFTVIALIETSSSATAEYVIGRWGNGLTEWVFGLTTLKKPVLYAYDNSAAKVINIAANNALSAYTKYCIACTYDGRSGATAATGMKLYVNGYQVAATVANDASYVAMECGTAVENVVTIGNSGGAGTTPWKGSITKIDVFGQNKSAQEMLANYNDPFNMFRGVPMYPSSGGRRRILVGG